MTRVLVVEAAAGLALALRVVLTRAGYTVLQAADGRSALRRLFADRPALLILDIGLPELDGWQVLERTRDLTDLPVILLSAYGSEAARVRGLRAGADDFLPKPFGNEELLARVEALLRRTTAARWAGSGSYGDERLRLVPERRSAVWHGVEVRLSDIEFRLLQTLVRSRGRVVTTEQLLDQVGGDPQGRGRERVKFAVMRLRRKRQQATRPEPAAPHDAARDHGGLPHPDGPTPSASGRTAVPRPTGTDDSLGTGHPTDPLEAVRGLGYRYREPGDAGRNPAGPGHGA
ncbi:response regulator transcription factor [Streptomyces sp. HSW2009]|uniref:response regulator transcription factor n=1 Tax=Streptomyces sp. HSW2009 TaxID=3142890 RepID=UPI0032F07BBC